MAIKKRSRRPESMRAFRRRVLRQRDLDMVVTALNDLSSEISTLRGEVSVLTYSVESIVKPPQWKKVTRKDIKRCLDSAEGKLNG